MSEEEKKEEETVAKKVDVPEKSEVEVRAMEQGWVDEAAYKAQFGDDPPKKWRDAEDFEERGGFFKQLRSQKTEITQLGAEVSGLKQNLTNVKISFKAAEEATYARGRKSMIDERNALIADGDMDKADKLDDDIEKLSVAQHKPDPASPDVADSEEVAIQEEWAGDNDWFAKDTELHDFAMSHADVLVRNNPKNLRGREFLDELTKAVKRQYPEKFKITPTRTPAEVGDPKPSPTSSSVITRADLPDEYKTAYDQYVKAGIMKGDVLIKHWLDLDAIPAKS